MAAAAQSRAAALEAALGFVYAPFSTALAAGTVGAGVEDPYAWSNLWVAAFQAFGAGFGDVADLADAALQLARSPAGAARWPGAFRIPGPGLDAWLESWGGDPDPESERQAVGAHIPWWYARRGLAVPQIPGAKPGDFAKVLVGFEHPDARGEEKRPIPVSDLDWYLAGWAGLERAPLAEVAGSSFQQEFARDQLAAMVVHSPAGAQVWGVFAFTEDEWAAIGSGFLATVVASQGAGVWVAAIGALVAMLGKEIAAIESWDRNMAAVRKAHGEYLAARGGGTFTGTVSSLWRKALASPWFWPVVIAVLLFAVVAAIVDAVRGD